MQNSVSPNRITDLRSLFVLSLIIILILQESNSFAEDSVLLSFVPARDKIFEASVTPNLVPPAGTVIVIGRYDVGGFEIDSTANIEVIAPDGSQIPLTVEKSSIYIEFGVIVSIKFCFPIPVASLQKATDVYTLRWGSDVNASNIEIDTIFPDPENHDSYREFRIGQANSGEASVATIEVIAESGADYYFLWYLLPMALLFGILTIRKMRARDSDSRSAA